MDAQQLIKRFEALESRHFEMEWRWRMCSDYVYPMGGKSDRRDKEDPSNHFMHDPTAEDALEKFCAALESILTPRGLKWHSLVTGYDKLDQDPKVGAWLEDIRTILFKARYAYRANFSNQMIRAYLSLGVYGTACVFVDSNPVQGLSYQCISPWEIYIEENSRGFIDTVFRSYFLTARQAYQEFGEDLPESIKKDASDPGRMDTPHEFLHGVMPRPDVDRQPGRGSAMDYPIASYHIAKQARALVREGGYRTMPYAVSRFSTMSGMIYGRSPAMKAMPYIVQLNSMQKSILRAAEKMVNPPLMMTDDDFLGAFSLRPGALNYGFLGADGQPKVMPFQLNGSLPVGLEMENQRREAIYAIFYNNLFRILDDGPGMTATEVMERVREKAHMLAPMMGLQQAELLGVIIDRETDLLDEAGAFAGADMPEIVAEVKPDIRPKYETQMARALEAQDGEAILKAFLAIGSMAEASPEIMKMVNYEKSAKIIWDSYGAPKSALQSDEDFQAILEDMRAKEQEAQTLAALQSAGAAGKDIGQAVNYLGQAEAQAQGMPPEVINA